MRIFDYIFYRTAKLFIKRDGSDAFTAVIVVSLIQFLTLLDVSILIARVFLTLDEIASFRSSEKTIGMLIGAAICIGNYVVYRKKYWTLASYWGEKETSFQRIIRGWLVVLAILLPFVVMILLGTVFGRK